MIRITVRSRRDGNPSVESINIYGATIDIHAANISIASLVRLAGVADVTVVVLSDEH